MKDKILDQFDQTKILYENFGEKIKGILTELIKDNQIAIHNISHRIKTHYSLSKKIDNKKDKYSCLEEITDLCGIRIITYLESDVNRVAEIIEREFEIDIENSVDKRKLNADQFGYKSLHYVVSLDNHRGSISENIKYSKLKLEIQVRSILQHAWAEIEHDLGYKGQISIPEIFKRNFNRLAALLETADVEFDRLKKDLSDYEIAVKQEIATKPNNVQINKASIASFTSTNAIFDKARQIIKKNTGCLFIDREDFIGELERFKLFKIETIGQLEKILKQNERQYLAFVDKFTKDIREEILGNTLPLFYFQHYLACIENSEQFLNEYFEYGTRKMGGDSRGPQEFLSIYNEIK